MREAVEPVQRPSPLSLRAVDRHDDARHPIAREPASLGVERDAPKVQPRQARRSRRPICRATMVGAPARSASEGRHAPRNRAMSRSSSAAARATRGSRSARRRLCRMRKASSSWGNEPDTVADDDDGRESHRADVGPDRGQKRLREARVHGDLGTHRQTSTTSAGSKPPAKRCVPDQRGLARMRVRPTWTSTGSGTAP